MACGQDTIIALEEEAARGGTAVGLDIATGEPCDPATAGIYDNYLVKRQARAPSNPSRSDPARHACVRRPSTAQATIRACLSRYLSQHHSVHHRPTSCLQSLQPWKQSCPCAVVKRACNKKNSACMCWFIRTLHAMCWSITILRVLCAQVLESSPVVASQLLLVDEVIRAGMNMRKG